MTELSPLIGAKHSGGEGGHQIVGQAEQHDGAGQAGQHWWVQVVDEPGGQTQNRQNGFEHFIV